MLAAVFRENGIEFPAYRFSSASVFREPFVRFDLIRDVDLSKTPPEVRLKSGEILFVSAELKRELESFAVKFAIPCVERADVWADLLEPFVDTEFSAADQERTLKRLHQQGFLADEVQSIRAKVKDPVLAYNSVVWDWTYLGLFDLLEAFSKNAPPEDFDGFYWYAMEIANRGAVSRK
jgi:hypothetical protein